MSKVEVAVGALRVSADGNKAAEQVKDLLLCIQASFGGYLHSTPDTSQVVTEIIKPEPKQLTTTQEIVIPKVEIVKELPPAVEATPDSKLNKYGILPEWEDATVMAMLLGEAFPLGSIVKTKDDRYRKNYIKWVTSCYQVDVTPFDITRRSNSNNPLMVRPYRLDGNRKIYLPMPKEKPNFLKVS